MSVRTCCVVCGRSTGVHRHHRKQICRDCRRLPGPREVLRWQIRACGDTRLWN